MPPFRDPSPVYGMDPETAARLVEAYRRARFSGTEEGLREAARILEEIRSGKYLPPIDWGQPEQEETPTPEATTDILRTDILAPAVTPAPQPTSLPQPAMPGPTPRPVIYSDPKRTALLQEVRTRTGAQRVRASQGSRAARLAQPGTKEASRSGKEVVTPPPGAARTRTELERREAVRQVRFIPPQIGVRPPSQILLDRIRALLRTR